MRRGTGSALLAAGLMALAAPAIPAAGGEAESGPRGLRLCHPDGEIRADRTPRGVRIRYLDKSGRADTIDFTLSGWEVRSASAKGGRACVELVRKKKDALGPEGEDVLSAKDEVIVYSGAFQEKVIIRRGQRVIELGGERITIEETEVDPAEGKRLKPAVPRK